MGYLKGSRTRKPEIIGGKQGWDDVDGIRIEIRNPEKKKGLRRFVDARSFLKKFFNSIRNDLGWARKKDRVVNLKVIVHRIEFDSLETFNFYAYWITF